MQNPYDMLVFAKVVELQSFSRTAHWLGISRSAVSKHVSRLERDLGARVLNRTTRKLKLTEAGSIAYPHCLQVARETDAGRLSVERFIARPKGLLRVSAPGAFGRMHIAPILPAYLARNKEVSVELVLSDRLVDLVDEQIDIAIQSTQLTHANLTQHKLASLNWILCASPDYVDKMPPLKGPADLTKHNCIFFTSSAVRGDLWELARRGESRRVQVAGNFRANNSEAVCDATVRGAGIGLLPTFVAADHVVRGALVPLLTGWTPKGTFGTSLTAYFIADRQITPKIRTLVDFLAERFKKVPPWDRLLQAWAGR